MMVIYQKASRVIAWLGPSQKDVQTALKAATLESKDQTSDQAPDLQEVIAGMTYIYNRPWFGRIWIQQEIFAARKLVFQCGNLSFTWPRLWSHPEKLTTLSSFQNHPSINRLFDSSLRVLQIRMAAQDRTMDEQEAQAIQVKIDALSTLVQLHRQNLHCFEKLSHPEVTQMDFIETLLDTATLGATDPRDHIYGILGITGFPAKPMTIEDWITARCYDVFLPIDYSADMTSLLCAVTWTLLMKGRLAVLAKFKAFHSKAETCQPTSPSWVIDWRLSAVLFWRDNQHRVDHHVRKTENAWGDISLEIRQSDSPWSTTKLNHARSPTVEHQQFCKDNSQLLPLTQIVVRGAVDPRFYAKAKGVWLMEEKYTMEDNAIWNLEVDVFSTDLIVHLHDSQSPSISRWDKGWSDNGSWLIRPTDHGHFKLIACLSEKQGHGEPFCGFYGEWKWNAKYKLGSSGQYRQCSVTQSCYTSYRRYTDSSETRTFIIV